MYDVVVIGAGVSGAYAAYLLSKLGFKVLVLEKQTLPRDKLCAGGVSLKARKLLEFDISPVIHRAVKRINFGYLGKKETFYEAEEPIIFVVDRREFDYFILTHAAGIDVRTKARVTDVLSDKLGPRVILDSGEQIQTKYVVIATGALDNIVSKVKGLKIRKYRGFGVEVLAYTANSSDEIYIDFGVPPDGYSWVFPRRDGYVVGSGNVYASADKLREALLEFLEVKPEYNTGQVSNLKGHPIDSIGNHRCVFGANNVYVIGEAAGLVDTLTGEGIYYGLLSAKILAEVLANSSSDELKIRLFNKRIQKEIAREIKYSYKLAKFINGRRTFAYSLIYKSSNLRRAFFSVFTGKTTYSSALRGGFILKKGLQIWKERLGLYAKKRTQ